MIDYEQIETLIATNLQTIIQSDIDYFAGYEFNITNEQKFIFDKKGTSPFKTNPRQIFIVIKTYPATLTYGSTLLPVQLDVISEKNKLEVSKRLLTLFAETYNLEFNSDMTIKQYYQSPSVLSNFNEIGDGFRSLLTLRGTLQISEKLNIIKKLVLVDGTEEIEIPMITSNVSFSVQLETQSLYNHSSHTQSWARVGTFVLNFSEYFTDTKLCNDMLYMIGEDTTNLPDGISTDFQFKITFKNGIEITKTLKLCNVELQQNLGELPVINYTFTK